ncbi:MAG: alpha-glucosidase [Eubacteriales bacterium]|nr:alpha-glucosidase [Eubacteriales bacterium]
MKKKWWHEKTAYQIYPKSFLDTNHDGIGDLRGIISKLDYLKELGIGIVWLSPVYCSPLADQGYDISDYYNVDPRFGTMEDLEELLAEAKKRDIHVVMDLVVNHCSDEHEWFKKACEDPDGKYGRYFFIEDIKDGKYPCNWRSYFGGGVWEPLPGHPDKCYLHLFHKKQPDLNWENPEVREDIYKMICWWLEKGLAGFRIDAIINIKKVLPWRDYPSDRADGLCSIQNMLEDAVGIDDFLGEMRDRCFRVYDAFTVGEVFNEKEEDFPNFISDDGYFSTMFDFRAACLGASEKGWYDLKPVTPDLYRDACFFSQRRAKDIGFYSNIIENHDEPRGVSRYIPEKDLNDTSKKMLATLQFMFKGLPFLYQGQEIGMENTVFETPDQIDDINTLDEYKTALEAGLSAEEALKAVARMSRDNARTPFQWSAAEHAGFTDGTPWLRVNPNYRRINLESQISDPNSVFQYYRKLTALRTDPLYRDCIVYGDFLPLWEDQHNLVAFLRKSEHQTLMVIANFQSEAREISLDQPYKKLVLTNLLDAADTPASEDERKDLTLQGYQAVILEL